MSKAIVNASVIVVANVKVMICEDDEESAKEGVKTKEYMQCRLDRKRWSTLWTPCLS